jgi:hypothetical protein
MFHLGGVLLALAIVLMVVITLLLPFALIGVCIWFVLRLLGLWHDSATAPVGAPRDDSARSIGWAVGLLVAGVLWMVFRVHFAALLLGLGAAWLTRGILEMRRRPVA